MQKPSCKWFAAMTEETPIYIQWPRGINGAIQGRLVDIDVDNGLCKLDCEFLFTDWTEIVLSKTRKEISGTMIGAYETVFGIGWASGPIIAGIISQLFGNDTPYLVFFVIGIGVAILSISKRRLLEPNKNPNL